MRSIFRASLPILLAATAVPAIASADPNAPTDSDKAAARPFAIEGLRLAQAGNCQGAADQLERAEALVHAPTTAVPLAQCDIQLGKLIAGTELLNRVINENIPANAPSSWSDAKKQASSLLAAAAPRVPKLRIHVDVPPGVPPNVEVTVDGQPISRVLLDNDRPTDPGQHRVVATQPGVGTAEQTVTLAEGQVLAVSLRLAGGAGGPPGGPAPNPPGVVPDPYGPGVVTPTSPGAMSGASGKPWMAFEFGVRLAFGIPFGSAYGGNGNDLDHFTSNQFAPLWLDAGVRLASHWYVGGYFSYGIASISNQYSNGACSNTGVGCSASDIRFGANAAYHLFPDGQLVDPWFGAGFGYEWASVTATEDAAVTGGKPATVSGGLDGWEFVNLQGGVDFRLLNGNLGVGPFVNFSLSQFVHQSNPSDTNGGTTGSSIQNQALHEWFLFGVRGDYDLKF